MSHTHASVLVHCVFSTKSRLPLIKEPELLWRYLAALAKDRKIHLFAAGGTANHVHLLMSVPPALCLATAMRELKAHSSRWIREHGYRFAWQEGYGAFTLSISKKGHTIAYIQAQPEHHRKRSFEEEFIAFLKRHGVEYDPRHVWG